MADPDCLFCKMASGQIPVEKLYDDDRAFAIRDIHPIAPTHILIIPKEHIPTASDIGPENAALLARLFSIAKALAQREGIDTSGYRLAINCGPDAGMSIYHLHMHMLGGHTLGPAA